MLLLLFIADRKRRLAQSLICAAISFFVFILPIVSRLSDMWRWVTSLVTHSGSYGSGEKNFIDLNAVSERMLHLLSIFPFFYLIILVLLLVLFTKLFSLKRPIKFFEVKVPILLLSVMLLQTVLVLKHPGDRYMLPVLPLAFVGSCWLVMRHFTTTVSVRSIAMSSSFLLGSAIILMSYSSIVSYKKLAEGRRFNDKSVAAIQAELAKYSNPIIIGAFRCMLPECALSFASYYAPSLVGSLAPILKNFVSFSGESILVFGEGSGNWIEPSRINSYIVAGRDVFFISPNSQVFDLKLLVDTPQQKLYRVLLEKK